MSDQQRFFRAYPTTVERTGPRQLAGRLVPYDVVADVLDELPDGSVDIYREGFRHGAFMPQATATGKGVVNKIGLVHRHDATGVQGLGFLGPFTLLREERDGLYGVARVLPSLEGDVEALLEAGVDELSVEFRLPRSSQHTVEVDGVRWRTRAHLDQVALEPKGAYSTAQVLAYRSEMDDALREQAETKAREEAERQEQERLEDEERERAEREAQEAEAAAQRRAEFDQLADRYDDAMTKQHELVRTYGVTQPSGWRRE